MYLGYLILFLIFLITFLSMVRSMGWREASSVWGITLAFVGGVGLAAWLIVGGWK